MGQPLASEGLGLEIYILRECVRRKRMNTYFSRGCEPGNQAVIGEKQSTAAQPRVRRIFRESQFFSRAEDIHFDVIDNNSLS